MEGNEGMHLPLCEIPSSVELSHATVTKLPYYVSKHPLKNCISSLDKTIKRME